MRGSWQIMAGGLACSQWPDLTGGLGNTVCYGVWVEGDVLVWLAAATGRGRPARILPGNQLRW